MALINTGPNYTRTGNGGLTKFANIINFVPWIREIPLFGRPIGAMIGYIDTAIEGIGWLLKGKPLSAATAVAAGAVSNTVNGLPGPIFWMANSATALVTGRSLGSHSRALTENVIGGVTGVLGVRPTVLRSYTAGMGSMNAQQQGPGAFMAAEARRRGQDPNAAYAAYANGNRDHVAALEASRMNPQGAYRG